MAPTAIWARTGWRAWLTKATRQASSSRSDGALRRRGARWRSRRAPRSADMTIKLSSAGAEGARSRMLDAPIWLPKGRQALMHRAARPVERSQDTQMGRRQHGWSPRMRAGCPGVTRRRCAIRSRGWERGSGATGRRWTCWASRARRKSWSGWWPIEGRWTSPSVPSPARREEANHGPEPRERRAPRRRQAGHLPCPNARQDAPLHGYDPRPPTAGDRRPEEGPVPRRAELATVAPVTRRSAGCRTGRGGSGGGGRCGRSVGPPSMAFAIWTVVRTSRICLAIGGQTRQSSMRQVAASGWSSSSSRAFVSWRSSRVFIAWGPFCGAGRGESIPGRRGRW